MSSSCAALEVSSSSSSSCSSDDEEFETDFIDRALKKAKGERTGEKERLGQLINSVVLAEQRRLCVRHEEAAPAPARGESGATQEEESARKQGKESTKKEAQRYVVKVVLRFTTKYIAHAHCKWA